MLKVNKSKKISSIVVISLFFVVSISSVYATDEWSGTWEFGYEEEPDQNQTEPPDDPVYDPQNGWWNSSWNYFKTITIDSSKIDNPLVNFPLLVTIPDATADKCDGGDSIRFLNTDNSTEYYYEIEKWVDNEDRLVWVNVSRVESASDTVFLMYYGNSGASDNQDSSNVWSGYSGVYHMNDSTTSTISDRTYNGHTGTKTSANNPDEVDGKIGKCQDYDSSLEDITVADDADFSFGDGSNDVAFSMSGWYNFSSFSPSSYNHLITKDTTSNREYLTWYYMSGATKQIKFLCRDASTVGNILIYDDFTISIGTWYYIAFTYDGSESQNGMEIYVNGIVLTPTRSTSNYVAMEDLGASVELGDYGMDNDAHFRGHMDEVRIIKNVEYNASWVKADFHSQNQTTGFLTFGSEQSSDVIFTPYTTSSFGCKAETQENIYPINSAPVPSKGSINVNLTPNLNITVNDPDGGTMNITKSTNASGGWIDIFWLNNTGNTTMSNSTSGVFTSYDTKYWWKVSTTNNISKWDNDTYYFTTIGKVTNITLNATTGIEETNATCHGYVVDNASNDTTCYFELDKESNSFESPEKNVSAGIVPQGSEFSENITSLENGTLYYCRVNANNNEGWTLSGNTVHFMTKPQPATNIQLVNISGGFNISWTHGDGYNISFLVFNTNHYPSSRVDGTNIYADSDSYYRHTNLIPATTYYYRVWERAEWADPVEIQYSDGNESGNESYAGTQPVLSNPDPANESTGISTSLLSWNITIESPMGTTFNWTIETSPNVGSNSTNDDTNGSKVVTLSGLNPGVTYTIFVNASETTNYHWSNETYWFTTEPNNPPTLSGEVPSNQSTSISVTPSLHVLCLDDDANTMNATWSSNSSGSWQDFAINTSIANNTNITQTNSNFSSYSIRYYWRVTLSDSNGDWDNETYWFTTKSTTFTPYNTSYFGCKTEVQGDEPFLSNEQPSNASIDTDMYPLLQITVNEPQDQNFNISWSTNATGSWIYYNSSCSDGTFSQHATFANASDTTYWWTIQVNDTTDHWTNATYHFTTATYTWSDWSDWWEFIYTCEAPADFEVMTVDLQTINLTWSLNGTTDKAVIIRNESGYAGYPVNQTNGTEIYNNTGTYYEDTGLRPATTYYYAVWGWNNTESAYSIINQTAYNITLPLNPPSSFSAIAYNQTQINITWASGAAGANTTLVIRNESGWAGTPSTPTNGTEIYNDTGTYVNDGDLSNETQYCYSAWSWNNTIGEYSLNYTSDCATTQGNFQVCCEYPVNESIENTRPPVNISVSVNGTNLDIYFYWYNMTPITDAWELVTNWTGQSTNRFEYTTLWDNGWIWGNTTYYWTVNVTNGNTWINNSYQYNTTQLVSGKNARMDMENDDDVDIFDCIDVYNWYTGGNPYDGFFDIEQDNDIDIFDVISIYNEYTS